VVVYTGRPLQVKYWGVATLATPAALTPMPALAAARYAARVNRRPYARAAIHRYFLASGLTAANPQQPDGTDGRMPDRFVDPAPHTERTLLKTGRVWCRQ